MSTCLHTGGLTQRGHSCGSASQSPSQFQRRHANADTPASGNDFVAYIRCFLKTVPLITQTRAKTVVVHRLTNLPYYDRPFDGRCIKFFP